MSLYAGETSLVVIFLYLLVPKKVQESFNNLLSNLKNSVVPNLNLDDAVSKLFADQKDLDEYEWKFVINSKEYFKVSARDTVAHTSRSTVRFFYERSKLARVLVICVGVFILLIIVPMIIFILIQLYNKPVELWRILLLMGISGLFLLLHLFSNQV